MSRCDDGNVIFLSNSPEASNAHEVMFGNAGEQNIVVWQACNEKHAQMGTTIKGAKDRWNVAGSRRYYLHFKGKSELDSFLGVLNISKEEWYSNQGRFYKEKYVKPANKVNLHEDDMDTDLDAQNKTMTIEEMDNEFGHDVYNQSQALF